MLACCNAARLWRDTCIGVDVLEKNVTCVTFGQPLLTIPYVQETVSSYTKFEGTIFCVYDVEDIFPKLFRDNYSHKHDQGMSLKTLKGSGEVSICTAILVGYVMT